MKEKTKLRVLQILCIISILITVFSIQRTYAKYFEKNQNILDIIEFLWENIVLEVPISYTNASGTHLSGQGWELNSKNEDDGLDPRFEKLNELFKGGE